MKSAPMRAESIGSSSIGLPSGHEKTERVRLGDRQRDRGEVLRRKARELEKRFLGEVVVSEKAIFQQEMAYMIREREKERASINLTYPVNPPYAFVNLLFDTKEGELKYLIKEPKLRDGEEELLKTVKSKLEATMDQEGIPMIEGSTLGRGAELSDFLKARFEDVLDLYDIKVEEKRKPVILYYLDRELLGLGRSDAIFRDRFIEDISCNGPNIPVFVYHRVFGSMKTNVMYPSELELNKYIFKFAQVSGKHISVYQPILDATLTDGSRINLTLGSEVTRKGSTFSIRKFSHDPISPIDLARFGSISFQQLAYMWHLIQNKRSILISGGTASGKTTLLNALCMFVQPEDKIVSIEDTPEIHIDHTNWIQSVSRTGYGMASGGAASGISSIVGARPGDVGMYDLLVAALRQRPEYVIVGEVRGREAFTLFQAISVGHASMSTIHAGTIDELIHRVENEPMNIPRSLFQSVDVVVFVGQVMYGDRRVRRVKSVCEILEVERETSNLITNEVFAWVPSSDAFHFSGRSFLLEEIARQTGKTTEDVYWEIRRKEGYLRQLDKKNLTNFRDVSRAVNLYYVDPTKATAHLEGE